VMGLEKVPTQSKRKKARKTSTRKSKKWNRLKYLSDLTPLVLIERGHQKVLFLFLT
jgi:hypothetical protein